MTKKNENVIESSVYVGLNGCVTVSLRENEGVKWLVLSLNNLEGSMYMELDALETTLLLEVLHDMKEKQNSSKHYRPLF